MAGSFFLFLYWLIGFDGITFSDDVYYLLAGKSFWEGTMEVNAYHFSSRWGAYVPAGLMGYWFGFDPHRISLISWIAYVATLALLLKALPSRSSPWILTIWFSSQVYFLHFLTKVYPDSLLVFWTCLIPFSAIFRNEKPLLAALGVISGLFFGFITKETIVFLAPFPVLLFIWDYRKKTLNPNFYWNILGLGFLFGSGYLAYFWINFGDPFYRVSSINAGHYISEFTYADKGIWSILRRITYLPVVTFIERAYWIWVVMAIPGIYSIWNDKNSKGVEMALAAGCLLVGFWFMTSTLEFYNPIYLNPRHLIILIPSLVYLIALGWSSWEKNQNLKRVLISLMVVGITVSLAQLDLKTAAFQGAFLILMWIKSPGLKMAYLSLMLLFPALASLVYQEKIKGYLLFIETLSKEVGNTENQSPILVNNFVKFSEEVLFPENEKVKIQLFPIEKLDSLKAVHPASLRVFLYEYYRHAYPKEQEDVEALELWLKENYTVQSEDHKGKVWIRELRLNPE